MNKSTLGELFSKNFLENQKKLNTFSEDFFKKLDMPLEDFFRKNFQEKDLISLLSLILLFVLDKVTKEDLDKIKKGLKDISESILNIKDDISLEGYAWLDIIAKAIVNFIIIHKTLEETIPNLSLLSDYLDNKSFGYEDDFYHISKNYGDILNQFLSVKNPDENYSPFIKIKDQEEI